LVIFGVPSAEFFRDGKKKSRNCGAGSPGTVGWRLKGLIGDGLGELGQGYCGMAMRRVCFLEGLLLAFHRGRRGSESREYLKEASVTRGEILFVGASDVPEKPS